MKIRSKVIKACMICGLIYFPVQIMYMITAAHLMMVTENTALSYFLATLFGGIAEAIPFLILIGKSKLNWGKKLVVSFGTVLAAALLLFLPLMHS